MKTINIEDKVFLNVPENFEYFKIDFDEIADYYVDFFSDIGLGMDLYTILQPNLLLILLNH